MRIPHPCRPCRLLRTWTAPPLRQPMTGYSPRFDRRSPGGQILTKDETPQHHLWHVHIPYLGNTEEDRIGNILRDHQRPTLEATAHPRSTRAQGVDMDIVRPSFKGQAAGRSEQPMLTGAVSRLPGVALDRRAAGDVDDSTPPAAIMRGRISRQRSMGAVRLIQSTRFQSPNSCPTALSPRRYPEAPRYCWFKLSGILGPLMRTAAA